MHIIPFSEARNSFKAVIDRVTHDHDVTVISRRDAPNAVLMSQAQYDSMSETLYLLSSPANAQALAQAVAQHRAGKAQPRQLAQD